MGVKGGGVHSASQIFNSDIIERRSRVLGYAIEARRQRFPEEEPYKYQPFNDANKIFQWNENSRKDLKDYNLDDLSI